MHFNKLLLDDIGGGEGLELFAVLLAIDGHAGIEGNTDCAEDDECDPAAHIHHHAGADDNPEGDQHTADGEEGCAGQLIGAFPIGMLLAEHQEAQAAHEVYEACGHVTHGVNEADPAGLAEGGEDAEEHGEQEDNGVGQNRLAVLVQLTEGLGQLLHLGSAVEHASGRGPEAHQGGECMEHTGDDGDVAQNRGHVVHLDQLGLGHARACNHIIGSHTADGENNEQIEDGGNNQSRKDNLPHFGAGEGGLLDHGGGHLKADELQGEGSHCQEDTAEALGEKTGGSASFLGGGQVVHAPMTAGKEADADDQRHGDHGKEEDVGKLAEDVDVEVGDDVPKQGGADGDKHLNDGGNHQIGEEVAGGGDEDECHHRRLNDLNQEHHPLGGEADLVAEGVGGPNVNGAGEGQHTGQLGEDQTDGDQQQSQDREDQGRAGAGQVEPGGGLSQPAADNGAGGDGDHRNEAQLFL